MMVDLFVSGGIVAALEQAAIAVGRLDAALAGNPLRRAWTFWSELDAARRHAGADGRKVDLFRLAAHLHGLPLRLGDTTSAPEGSMSKLGRCSDRNGESWDLVVVGSHGRIP